MKNHWLKLESRDRAGILMSLFGVVGWALAYLSIKILGVIFDVPTHLDLAEFFSLPTAVIVFGVLLNLPFGLGKVPISPKMKTTLLTGMHGFWGQYVGLQIHPSYNGFFVLFLFSFGLMYLRISHGFFGTMVFSIFNTVIALGLLVLLEITFGTDEKLFIFFVVFSGLSAALLNEIQRRKVLKYREIQSVRKHASEQMQKILYPHQLQIIEKGLQLENTMPISDGSAVCLVFQIRNATAIKHEKTQQIFRELFASFSLMILKEEKTNMDERSSKIDAFRVSEFGDKFVCSIGFPFPCNHAFSASEAAVRLSELFYLSFLEHTEPIAAAQKISCKISIARGALEGYFSKGLPIEYQLNGEALEFAERLNEFHTSLVEKLELDESLILIQEIVYNSLPSTVRALFNSFSLSEHQMNLRGASQVQRIYYRQIESKKSHPLEKVG